MGRPARKLPISGAVGRSPEFLVTNEIWSKVETAYGQRLLDPARQSIIEATNKFLAAEIFERNAKASKPAIDLIESIKTLSDNLRKQLSASGGDAGAFAQYAIRENFDSAHFKREPYEQLFHALGSVMFSLSVACTRALTEINGVDSSVFRDGMSWDDWIRTLTEIAKEHDLPTGASKAGSKEKEIGPFARLITALQEHLPKGTQRHANTRLSSSIHLARRQPIEPIQEL